MLIVLITNHPSSRKRADSMISIIVPIYNVKPYLAKSLNSLAALEPVDIGIEIILIDDGSTDGSGAVADEYAEKHSNFTVYHTENHGLSAARNYGIERANGEWIMFLDSDDWAEPSFCSVPFDTAVRNGADLVSFNYYIDMSDDRIIRSKGNHLIGCISREEAIEYCEVNAWSKLYKRELFDDVRFPEGHVYEDLATTHKLFCKARKIAAIDEALVHYTGSRSDSISHTETKSNIRDMYDACIQRYSFLKEHGFPVEKHDRYYHRVAFIYCIHMQPVDDERYFQAEKIIDELKYIPKEFPIKMKIMFILWKVNKKLFHTICRILGKKAAE